MEIGYVDENGRPLLSRATLSKIENETSTRANASIEDLLALSAALDVPPVHLLAPLRDDEIVQVTKTLQVTAPLARVWIRGRTHLRHLLGVGNSPEDVLAFLSQLPADEFRLAARAMGLDEDQVDDAAWGVRRRQSPWPGGRPLTKPQSDLLLRQQELERELRAVKVQLTEEGNDGE